MSKRLNKEQVQLLILEKLQEITFAKRIDEERSKIMESYDDFYGTVVRALAEEQLGENYNPELIDEGFMSKMWDKAKNMVSFGKAADSDKLRQALAQGADASLANFVDELEEIAPNFPNTKSENAFTAALAKISGLYKSLVDATKKSPDEEGFMNADAANAVIEALGDYLDNAQGSLSKVYKYMKESEGVDFNDGLYSVLFEGDEDALLEAAPSKRAGRLIGQIAKLQKKNPKRAARKAKALGRMQKRLLAKQARKKLGAPGESALAKINQNRAAINKAAGEPVIKGGAAGGAAGGGGGSASAAPSTPDGGPDDRYSDPGDADLDPGETDSFGNYSDPGDDGDMAMDADFGTSDVDPGEAGGAATDIASSLMPSARTLAYLGIGGAAAAAAGYAAYKYLKGKREKGDSREGLMGDVEATLQTVSAPAATPTGQEPEQGAQEVPGQEPAAPGQAPDGAAAAEAPAVTRVDNNNLATRDADNYDGSGKLNPQGLALAKAQVDFLQKQGKPVPGLLSKAIADVEGGGEDDTISDEEITGGLKSPDFGGLAETVNRWQKIAGILKG